MSLCTTKSVSVIGLCPAGSQRCGVPAGLAGVEEGEEGDAVRAAPLNVGGPPPCLRMLGPHTRPGAGPRHALKHSFLAPGINVPAPVSRTTHLLLSDVWHFLESAVTSLTSPTLAICFFLRKSNKYALLSHKHTHNSSSTFPARPCLIRMSLSLPSLLPACSTFPFGQLAAYSLVMPAAQRGSWDSIGGGLWATMSSWSSYNPGAYS